MSEPMEKADEPGISEEQARAQAATAAARVLVNREASLMELVPAPSEDELRDVGRVLDAAHEFVHDIEDRRAGRHSDSRRTHTVTLGEEEMFVDVGYDGVSVGSMVIGPAAGARPHWDKKSKTFHTRASDTLIVFKSRQAVNKVIEALQELSGKMMIVGLPDEG